VCASSPLSAAARYRVSEFAELIKARYVGAQYNISILNFKQR